MAPRALLRGNWVLWAPGQDSEEGSPCPLLETKCSPRAQRPLRRHWPQVRPRGAARNPPGPVLSALQSGGESRQGAQEAVMPSR